jgi:hypothetical protein
VAKGSFADKFNSFSKIGWRSETAAKRMDIERNINNIK